MPFEEALKRFAPKKTERKIDIHKDDGTVCVLPYCSKDHKTYKITYTRTNVEVEEG